MAATKRKTGKKLQKPKKLETVKPLVRPYGP